MFKFLNRLFVGAIALSLVTVSSSATMPQEVMNQSVKDLRVLSPDWICAVVDPTAEILAVRNAKFQVELDADKKKYEEDKATGKTN
jgi:hypothetical protein